MNNDDGLKSFAESTGGETWGLLSEASKDVDFIKQILTSQEQGLFKNVVENPRTINGYKDYFYNILSKYLAWKMYKETKLDIVDKKYASIIRDVDAAKKDLDAIRDAAGYIGGATVLVEYSKSFKTSSIEHGDSADEFYKMYILSLLALGAVIAMAFFLSIADFDLLNSLIATDLQKISLSAAVFSMKFLLLITLYQIMSFYRKNYNAEKHLQEVYKHRSDVLQSLHVVYSSIKDEKERDKILTAGVLLAYERGETGYITTKEGAGSGDNLLENILRTISNK